MCWRTNQAQNLEKLPTTRTRRNLPCVPLLARDVKNKNLKRRKTESAEKDGFLLTLIFSYLSAPSVFLLFNFKVLDSRKIENYFTFSRASSARQN